MLLPADKRHFNGQPVREEKPFKTLYLLHGVFGSNIDWVVNTSVIRYADENDLCIVMPAGDNAFYLDHPEGGYNYGKYIGEELVELTRKMFPLSRKREDTFIGGLSMGGYGALRNGLEYSETFGAIIALSSALVYEIADSRTNDTDFLINRRDYAEMCFGDLEKLIGSNKDPKALARSRKEEGKALPAIYMACGESDSLLGLNNSLDSFLTELEIPHTYKTGPGAHEWNFWDTYIKDAIYNWLPTEKNGAGVNSGNVGN